MCWRLNQRPGLVIDAGQALPALQLFMEIGKNVAGATLLVHCRVGLNQSNLWCVRKTMGTDHGLIALSCLSDGHSGTSDAQLASERC